MSVMQRTTYRMTVCLLVPLIGGCAQSPSIVIDPMQAEYLNEMLRASMEASDLPGVVALVTSRDDVLYRQAYGVMDPSTQEPLTTDAFFPFYSMTKPITSLGLMMLHEEGLVELDAPASDYLPELTNREVLVRVDTAAGTAITRSASRAPTVRDLLRHTSGFGYTFSSPELRDLDTYGELDGRAQPILHDPGERWTYGMSTVFVGWIVEEVSGQSLSDFFETRIFTPLGMNETSFGLPRQQMGRLVSVVRRVDGSLSPGTQPDSIVEDGRGDPGLLSTADDYARFVQLMLGKGERDGTRLLSEASVAEMGRDQLDSSSLSSLEPSLNSHAHFRPAPGATASAWASKSPLGVLTMPARREV
jgi:methyl acetate hydrolase